MGFRKRNVPTLHAFVSRRVRAVPAPVCPTAPRRLVGSMKKHTYRCNCCGFEYTDLMITSGGAVWLYQHSLSSTYDEAKNKATCLKQSFDTLLVGTMNITVMLSSSKA